MFGQAQLAVKTQYVLLPFDGFKTLGYLGWGVMPGG